MVPSIFVMWLPAMMNGLVMSSQISCEVIDQLQEEKKKLYCGPVSFYYVQKFKPLVVV